MLYLLITDGLDFSFAFMTSHRRCMLSTCIVYFYHVAKAPKPLYSDDDVLTIKSTI